MKTAAKESRDWSKDYAHPKWQQKRLEALNAAGYKCQACGATEEQLHVHHIRYHKGAKVWEYDVEELAVLCEHCHTEIHRALDSARELIFRFATDKEIANGLVKISLCFSDLVEESAVFRHAWLTTVWMIRDVWHDGWHSGYATGLEEEKP